MYDVSRALCCACTFRAQMVIACVDEGSNLTLNTVQLVSTSFSFRNLRVRLVSDALDGLGEGGLISPQAMAA